MTPCQKIKPVRSERYLDFIRSKPCIDCGKPGPSEASHQSLGYRGTGTRVSDLQTVAKCHECHAYEHQHGSNKVSGLNYARDMVNYINEFFGTGGKL